VKNALVNLDPWVKKASLPGFFDAIAKNIEALNKGRTALPKIFLA